MKALEDLQGTLQTLYDVAMEKKQLPMALKVLQWAYVLENEKNQKDNGVVAKIKDEIDTMTVRDLKGLSEALEALCRLSEAEHVESTRL